jgi:hypothetical protein
MSFQTTSYVIKRKFGNQTRKLIMLCIADYTGDDTGTAWAYIDTLADRAECSRRSVQEHLDHLEKHGEIEIYRNAGPKGSHRYRIIFKKSEDGKQPMEGDAEFAPRSNEQVQISAKGCKSAPLKQHERGANQRRSFAPKTILKGNRREEREETTLSLDAEAFAEAMHGITTARDEWAIALTPDDREMFNSRAEVMHGITTAEWQTIRRYLHARHPQGSGAYTPLSRERFIRDIVDIRTRALDWDRKQPRDVVRPREPIQTPDEKATAERELAEWLAEQKALTRCAS